MVYTFNYRAIRVFAQFQVVKTIQYTTHSFMCSTQKSKPYPNPNPNPNTTKLYNLQKYYDQHNQGFDWFTNLLQTTHASCTYLHNIVAHEFITIWGKLISSLPWVMQTRVDLAYLPLGWD